MRQALALARRGLGRTWPNPSVGCVIVKNGHVVGVGAQHKAEGRTRRQRPFGTQDQAQKAQPPMLA